MTTKTSCGPLYYRAKAAVEGLPKRGIDIYAAGFANGEAEKVYLGACLACMFRPPTVRDLASMLPAYEKVAEVYGLGVLVDWDLGEAWMYRQTGPAHQMVLNMTAMRKNIPAWHIIRAQLCGIPANEIDEQFHLRQSEERR